MLVLNPKNLSLNIWTNLLLDLKVVHCLKDEFASFRFNNTMVTV